MSTYISVSLAVLLFSCTMRSTMPLGTSWNRRSGVFTWRNGEVTLPSGLRYQQDAGDSLIGHFTSSDGKLIIHHDIGGYAGAYANMRGNDAFEERTVEGVRVWTGRRKWPRGETMQFAVTFPDNGCANFYLHSSNLRDAAIIEGIARSFRPKIRSVASVLCGSER